MFPEPTSTVAPMVREILRAATSATHERLHGHNGLAAVAAGTIDLAAYKALLCRLYGFHRPFETAARVEPERTRWLENDLTVLGIGPAAQAALPRCAELPATASPEYFLGAHYVVEGSALGGRGLAKQLDGLLGAGNPAGRHFFSGHGAETGNVWRGYLARLSAAPAATAACAAIVLGATTTFAIFERWLDGWNDQNG